MSRSPTLAEVLRAALDKRSADLHVAMPGRVTRYDSSKQQADVQPCLKADYRDEEGERVVEQLPVVPNVPIVFPGAGGFRVTFPVAVGDTVLLVFADASLDVWLTHGGIVDPRDCRTHHLTDAVAIPGLRDFGHPLKAPPSGVATIGIDSGTFEGAGLGETIKGHLDELKTWADTHTHGGAKAAPLSPIVPTVASATLKVSR